MSAIVFLNGKFVPETEATVSIFDRGFLYGDGLFETLRVFRGQLFCWAEHLERLERGAAFLKIKIPFAPDELLSHATQLIQRNRMPESLLRISLSRGVGPRGYSPRGADRPTLTMSVHSAPDASAGPPAWHVVTASYRLPAGEPLAQFKTANKLPQVLARAEADAAGADEALLLNTNGEIVEASMSNFFWIANGTVCTPPLNSGILAGVTRLVVTRICGELGLAILETSLTPAELLRAEGIFLSMSSWGIVEVASLDKHPIARSPLSAKIRAAYDRMTNEIV
ncbi:MAG TPA: aminotransferase class IV [Verrucomicrobiae bacterium]|jgi:aminodeoxychorismate lyase|nr:aminotransferase class IV [Verrucomicrobiae bacterium]